MKKIPDGCIEIPLEEVDYIYQPPQSHTPVIVMKQKLPPMQSRVLECMRCGSKKNLNTNKDKSFVECDECMWGEECKPDIKLVRALQEDFKKLYVKEYTTDWKEQRYIRNIELGIMRFDNLEKFISQLLSERTFTKEELELILYNINYNEGDEVTFLADEKKHSKLKSKISKLLKEKE